MTGGFHLRTATAFERQVRKLSRYHPDLLNVLREARHVLATDPYNRSRTHSIRKLEGGGYRLRHGRWRIIYTIDDTCVRLVWCRLRRESTYRGY